MKKTLGKLWIIQASLFIQVDWYWDAWNYGFKALNSFEEIKDLEGVAESYFLLGIICWNEINHEVVSPNANKIMWEQSIKSAKDEDYGKIEESKLMKSYS